MLTNICVCGPRHVQLCRSRSISHVWGAVNSAFPACTCCPDEEKKHLQTSGVILARRWTNERTLLGYMLTEEWCLGLWHCVGSSSTFIAKLDLSILRELEPLSVVRAPHFPIASVSKTNTVNSHPATGSARNIRQSIRFLLVARVRYVVGLQTIQGIW
jgi:hypothetical protein